MNIVRHHQSLTLQIGYFYAEILWNKPRFAMLGFSMDLCIAKSGYRSFDVLIQLLVVSFVLGVRN